MESMPSRRPRLCKMVRGPDGYGFNLHGEKGQHGQYIRAVDDDSPAKRAGLRSGDRVIEVDGVNIERETHSQVVARIKAGGGTTTMLVVDKELDSYFRKNGITIKESMVDGYEEPQKEEESPRINGEQEVETEVHVNGVENGEVIVASVEATEESVPERRDEVEEEPAYTEIERREEEVEEKEEEEEDEEVAVAAVAMAAVEVEERREEEEKEEEKEEEPVVAMETVAVEESIPDMTQSTPPARPATSPPKQSGLEFSSMEKARILAAGRKKKKQASAKNWEDKFAAFNNL